MSKNTKRLNSNANILDKIKSRNKHDSYSINNSKNIESNNNINKLINANNSYSCNNNNNNNTTNFLINNNNNELEDGNIRVVCRVRPLNNKEKVLISEAVCTEFINQYTIKLNIKNEDKLSNINNNNNNNHNNHSNKPSSFEFTFDKVFNCESKQIDVFEETAKPIINSVLKGFNGTVLAYGQTSSGKSYTMQGVLDNKDLKGIMPRMMEYVFNHIDNLNSTIECKVNISICELYQEKLKDLLDVTKQNLQIRENKNKEIYIEDITEKEVLSAIDVLNLLKKGCDNRIVSSTNMNDVSSRSHLILIMQISQFNLNDLSKKTGKLFMVDLAGSEKISKTNATGTTLDEAKGINKSLTTLGMVINALTENTSNKKQQHIPYRDSKLTRLLCESLGGNSKTVLIITLSPSSFNDLESLSSLRFGYRAKKIKNKAKINKETSLQELKLEIDKLNIQMLKYQWRLERLVLYLNLFKIPIPEEDEELTNINDFYNKVKDNLNVNNINNVNKSNLNYTCIKEEMSELEQTQVSIIMPNKNNIKPVLAVDRNKKALDEVSIIKDIKDINDLDNIKVKYVELLYVVSQIEEEKEDLKSKLNRKNNNNKKTFINDNLMIETFDLCYINSNVINKLNEFKIDHNKTNTINFISNYYNNINTNVIENANTNSFSIKSIHNSNALKQNDNKRKNSNSLVNNNIDDIKKFEKIEDTINDSKTYFKSKYYKNNCLFKLEDFKLKNEISKNYVNLNKTTNLSLNIDFKINKNINNNNNNNLDLKSLNSTTNNNNNNNKNFNLYNLFNSKYKTSSKNIKLCSDSKVLNSNKNSTYINNTSISIKNENDINNYNNCCLMLIEMIEEMLIDISDLEEAYPNIGELKDFNSIYSSKIALFKKTKLLKCNHNEITKIINNNSNQLTKDKEDSESINKSLVKNNNKNINKNSLDNNINNNNSNNNNYENKALIKSLEEKADKVKQLLFII